MTSASVRRVSFIQLGVVLVALLGFGFERDVWLLVRLKIAADDAFAMGSAGFPLLMDEDRVALASYPPARVAEFLRFPDAGVRAAAYLALANRHGDSDSEQWVGVAPRLGAAFVEETDEVARECARIALLTLPVLPLEDAAAVAALVDEMSGDDDRGPTLRGAVAKSGSIESKNAPIRTRQECVTGCELVSQPLALSSIAVVPICSSSSTAGGKGAVIE